MEERICKDRHEQNLLLPIVSFVPFVPFVPFVVPQF